MASKESHDAGTAGPSSGDPAQWMTQYARMNIEMMQSALKSISPAVTAWTNWYQSLVLPQVRDLSKMASGLRSSMPRGCCDIPETGCPPRCACTLSWQASAGELRKATIEIHNTSAGPITYELASTAFEACGKVIDVKPAVHPRSITAAAGQTVTATVEVPVGDLFHPGATYHAEILVRGKYERCVRLELCMRCDDESVCRVEHGDIPYRKRADEWFRHFQCSEPCFQPIVQPNVPANPLTPGTPDPNRAA